MKKFLAVLMAVAMMATMATFAMAADADGFYVGGIKQTDFATAVTAAGDSGTIVMKGANTIAGGTVTVDKAITLKGDGARPTLTVEATYFQFTAGAIIENLTITRATGSYAIRLKNANNIKLKDVTVTTKNGEKKAIDINGVTGATLENVTCDGMVIDRCSNIKMTGNVGKITMHDKWGSVSDIDLSGATVSTLEIENFPSDRKLVPTATVEVPAGFVPTGATWTKERDGTTDNPGTNKVGKFNTTIVVYTSTTTAGGTSPTENSANDPKTTEQVAGTIAALADPAKELPKEAERTTTAGGAAITVIPVQLTSGAAALDVATANLVGNGSKAVGLQASVDGGAMVVTMPGGFGAVTEPGRLYYPLDYSKDAPEAEAMLAAVRGADASSDTMKVGANMTMPTAVSVDVETNLADGAMANIYHYNPETGLYTFLGKHKVNAGRVAFMTKLMGQMLMTTGTI